MHSLLNGLNPQQQRAVQAIAGPVLVLAGPGSGKTRVLTHRIAYLIREVGVSPYHILAVTFTNKAAREMRERLEHLIGAGPAKAVAMGTFHSICARWLRRDIHHLGRSRDFVVYDADDQLQVMRQVLRELDLDEKRYPPRSIHGRISSAKNELVSAAEFPRYATTYYDEMVARCYERYEHHLVKNNALDFDDLLLKVVALFEQEPEVLRRYQEQFVHVMVDEVQDTNRVQYALINQVGAGHNNYFLIGDIQQSIYAWRGARIANVLEFEQAHPDVEIIPLEQNYRSTQPILDVAQAIIEAAADRRHQTRIWTEQADGPQVRLIEAYDHDEEAAWVADEVLRLRATENRSLAEFAVMYRTNAQSRVLEEAFRRRALRYKLVGGTRFYERKEIKDLIAYLRLIHNPFDDVSFGRILNVPARGIGDKTRQDLVAWAGQRGQALLLALESLSDGAQAPFGARPRTALLAFAELMAYLRSLAMELPLSELLDKLVERLGYREALTSDYGEEEGEERWENVVELHNATQEYEGLDVADQLPRFLEEVALISDVDSLDRDNEPGVTLITLHQAKGLEYPVVFLLGLEEGLLPHSRSINERDSLEEERRLFYVGATRAKQRLYLLHALKRAQWGRVEPSVRSRFIDDIPPDLIAAAPTRQRVQAPNWNAPAARVRSSASAWAAVSNSSRPKRPEPGAADQQPASFADGQKVRHAVFGEGVVVSSKRVGDDEEVAVAFPGKGIKRLLAAFARLERVE